EGADVVASLAAAATAFWIFGFLPHVAPGKADWGALDLEMYFYPKFAYGAAALARGRVPLWNPHEFCGLPFLATAQVAALYPVKNVLFWLFSPPLALHVNYVVHLVLAGAPAYAWARWLDLRAAAAAAGAAVRAFNPYFRSSVYPPPRLMAVPRVLWGALASLFLFAGPAMGFAVGGLVLGRAPVRWFLAAALVLVQAGPYLEPLPGYRWLRASWSLWPIFGYFFVATLAALGVERSLRQDRGMLVLLLGAPVLAAAVGFWLARYVPASALLA